MLAPFLVIGCLLAGDPATNDALKVEVNKLVRDLNDDSKATRIAAKDKLLKLGPPVLDLLPEPNALETGSVFDDIREIRKKLQEAAALKSVEGSTVTLHGRMKVSKILAEIQKQTGNTIADLPRAGGAAIPDPEIAVEFDKKPFWAALDSVLDQAQLSVYPYGQPRALQIVPRGPNDLPRSGRADLQGPLRIEAISVLTRRELRSSSSPALQVMLEVAWEPRLRPISVKQRMADIKALDSSGGSLTAEDPQAEPEPFVRTGTSAVELGVALNMPAKPIKEIASLKGTLQTMLLGRVEKFRFGNLLNGKKQQIRIAAATVEIDEVRKNGDTWQVNVRLRYDDAGDALESHRNWALSNEAFLEDAAGKNIQPDASETFERTKNTIGISYVFAVAELPKNAVFVYKTPGMIVTKDFKYEVRGIKMP